MYYTSHIEMTKMTLYNSMWKIDFNTLNDPSYTFSIVWVENLYKLKNVLSTVVTYI